MEKLRILIADDHAPIRRNVRSLVESHPGWTVCGEASNGRQAVEETRRLKPDIVLLDVSMPELDGIQASREIVQSDPDAQVLILTIHEPETVAEQAALAGAKGVVSKAAAHRTLIETIESLWRNLVHLAGSIVGRERHIGALFHSWAGRFRVLGPFISETLSRGIKVTHIINESERNMYVEALGQSGVDLRQTDTTRAPLLIPWEEGYLAGKNMDQESKLTNIRKLLAGSTPTQLPHGRLIGDPQFWLGEASGLERLLEFESRLNELLTTDDIVICPYDLTRFDASFIVDVIRVHPAILVDETFHANPFYVPPERMLRELKERKQV